MKRKRDQPAQAAAHPQYAAADTARLVPELQAQLAALISSVDAIVWEADADTFQFTFVSPRCERILGYAPSRWIEEPTFWADHVHPDDRAETVRYCQQCTRETRDHEFECRMLAADGRVVWLRDIVTVVVENGRAVKLRGVMVDITESKRADGALRASELIFRELFEQAADGIFVVNAHGQYVDVNAAGAEMLGYSREEVLRLHHYDMLVEEERPRIPVEVSALAGGQVLRSEWRCRRKDGSCFIGEVVARIRADGCLQAIMRDVTERQQAEQALRESQATLEGFFNATNLSLNIVDVVADDDVRYVLANRQAAEFWGSPAAGIAGRRISELGLPEDLRRGWVTELRDCLAGGVATSAEVSAAQPDGERWYLRSMVPVGAVAPNRLVVAAVDITERKRAELALRNSEERLRLALDSARMGTFDWEVKGKRIIWSRWHEELWGFRPGEFGGTYEEFSRRVHPEDRAGIKTDIVRCLAARTPFACDFRVVWPDGSVHWISSTGEFTFEEGGGAVRMRGVVVETTARRQAEDALRESEERHRSLSELISDYAYSFRVQADDTVQGEWLSKSFTRMFGFTREEIASRGGWHTLVYPDDKPAALRHLATVISEGAHTAEWRFVTRAGETRWVRDYARAVRAADGRVVRVYGASQDITARKQAEEQINQQVQDLRRWYDVTLGREERVQELKRQVNELLARLGEPPRYPSQEPGANPPPWAGRE